MASPARRIRRLTPLWVAAVVLLTSVTGVAVAQSTDQFGGTVVVEADETVDGFEGVAGTIVVRGTVAGDLSATAGTVRIAETGSVEGDVAAAAGSVTIAGAVDGDVRLGAGSFDLTDTGRIGGSVAVGAGAVSVDGTVEGDVRAAGEAVRLGPNADVSGEFRYDAERFDRSPDASVAGAVVADPDLRQGVDAFGGLSLPPWLGTLYGFATGLLLGTILLFVFPAFSEAVAVRAVDAPAVSTGVGLLTLIAVPIVLLLIAITIVGLPFAAAGIVLYALGVWIATLYGKYAVGRWVLRGTDRENRWLALLVGLTLFLLLGFVPVVGALAELFVLLLGLGALVSVLRDRYRGRGEPTESAGGS